MRQIFIIIAALGVFSCTSYRSKQSSAAVNLKYSAFMWHYNGSADSFQLYVATYLELRGDSFFVMRHKSFLDSAHFYAGVINEAVRREVDSFPGSTYNNYKEPYGSGFRIYDGFYYCLDLERTGYSRDTIFFVPGSAPARLRQFASLLDSVVDADTSNKIDPFAIESYKASLAAIAERAGMIPPKVAPPDIKIRK